MVDGQQRSRSTDLPTLASRPLEPADPSAATAVAGNKSRLRDSCHACASSKVRCHKEKPICSRCANRGITCEYYETKRPGRRRGNNYIRHSRDKRDSHGIDGSYNVHDNRNHHCNKNKNSNSSTISVDLLSPSSLTSQLPLKNPYSDFSPVAITPASSNTWDLKPQDLFSNLLSPAESDPAFSSAPSLYTDENDVFNLPIDLKELDTSFNPSDDNAELVAFSPKNNTFSGFGDAFLAHRTTQNDSRLQSSPSFNIANARVLAATRGNGNGTDDVNSSSPCCCLTRALGLIKHSLPKSTSLPACSMSTGAESCYETSLEAQIIVIENQQTLEVLNNILQCSCSQDSYLLTILVVIVFQVLDWYEVVAFELPNSSMSSTSAFTTCASNSLAPNQESLDRSHSSAFGHVSDIVFRQSRPEYCTPGEDLSRIAAQSVLSQLHHVQRVINQLSLKLKFQGTLPNDCGSGDGTKKISSPFSTSTLDHVEIDLRRRLRDLANKIINMLRQA